MSGGLPQERGVWIDDLKTSTALPPCVPGGLSATHPGPLPYGLATFRHASVPGERT